MHDTRTNAATAIIALIAAALMLAALSFAIGKWSFGKTGYDLIIKFPNATGVSANSEVKFAGAPAGRVKEVRLIPRDQQTMDPNTRTFNCVEVVAEVDKNIQVGEDATATIKQDGLGIAAKYVLLTPGPDHDSKLLADGAEMQGHMPFDLTDLVQPAGEALSQAKVMITQLGPILNRLDGLSQQLSTSLPPLLADTDKFVQHGDGVVQNFSTPAGRQRLNDMLDSLKVSSENLKVVSTNAKALTATLAQKPWRVFWGGTTTQPPPEDEVLKSNEVIKLKPDVDVNAGATPTK